MKTPKEYKLNLENGIVTANMLEDVIYSYNKRAKNYRDRARSYREKRQNNRYWYDMYGNEEQCEEKKEMFYDKKSDILLHSPKYLTTIHKISRLRRIRIEDTEDEYDHLLSEINAFRNRKSSIVVYENEYFDYDSKRYISFVDVYKKIYDYYLYYEFPRRSFHSPINKDEDGNVDLSLYKNLNIIELEKLTTYGKDVKDLLSLQFCDKVYQLLITKK